MEPTGTHASWGMVRPCEVEGCGRLTMGGTCVEHDAEEHPTFPIGRPYVSEKVSVPSAAAAPGAVEPALVAS